MASKDVPAIKLLMLGDSGVGKSSIMTRYSDDTFTVNMIATTGVDFKVKEVTIDGKRISLRIWDTAGQERFKTITKSYYRGAMGIILCYDVTDEESFAHVKYWAKNIEMLASPSVAKLLLGNKVDMDGERKITTAQGQQLADECKFATFIEASAKTNVGIDQAFVAICRDILKSIDEFTAPHGTQITSANASSSSSRSGCCS